MAIHLARPSHVPISLDKFSALFHVKVPIKIIEFHFRVEFVSIS